jgi:pilus assembly protein CpaE
MSADMQTTAESLPEGTGRTRVVVTGRCRGLAELCDRLADETQLDLPGWVSDVRSAAGMLESDAPTVVLHATPGDELPRDELAWLREHTDQPIVLLTDVESGRLFQEAMAAGIADVLVLPQSADRVEQVVQRVLVNARGPVVLDTFPASVASRGRSARVFAVLGPKGGSGKTTVATNLAAALLHNHVKRTLLIDLDLQFGDAALVLGVEPEKTIYDLLVAPGELDAAKLAGYTIKHASGIDLLPAPLRPEDAELVTEDRVAALLAIAREEYDAIVVDTPSYITGATLATLDAATDLLLLVGLEVASLKNVRLALRTLDVISYQRDRIRLVLNTPAPARTMKRRELQAALDVKVQFELPYDDDVAAIVSRGELPVLNGRSGFSAAIRDMASGLVDTNGKKSRIPSLRGAS